jgi:hypothetical protein
MTPEDFTGAMTERRDVEPPPPAGALLQAVGAMKPVRTRGRLTAFLLVLAAGVIAPLVLLLLRPLRGDIGGLPPAWVGGAALVWLAAVAVSLAAALVPARGDVLPSAGRAARVGGVVTVSSALAALLGTVDAPGLSHVPAPGLASLLMSSLRCIAVALPIAAVFVLAGFLALRRVLPMGARRIGVALGAAGGAMGGLALHFHCAIATPSHVLLGHVGGVALAALAGALALPALLQRASAH